jgi:hypothetical protein
LTLGLLLNGCQFLAEDVAVLDHDSLHLVPSGTRIAVRRESLSLFPELTGRWTKLPHDPAGDPFPQVAFTTPAALGVAFADRCPLTTIVFPVYDARLSTPRLERLSEGQAVLLLVEHCTDLGTSVEAGLDFVIRLAKDVPVYAMRYRDARQAVHQILDAASEIARSPFPQILRNGFHTGSSKERYETN